MPARHLSLLVSRCALVLLTGALLTLPGGAAPPLAATDLMYGALAGRRGPSAWVSLASASR